MNEFLIELQAKLDEAKSKGNINSDIEKIQEKINKLKLQVEIDPKIFSDLIQRIERILNQKIDISNIGIDQKKAVQSAQQTGQKVGQVISDSAEKAIKISEKSIKLQTNIDTEKKILQVYTTELKEAGVLTGDVKTKIQEMFHSLSKVDSQNGLTTWRAELKGVKAETDAVLKSVTQLSQKKLDEIQLSIDNGSYETQLLSYNTSLQKLGLSSQEIAEKLKNASSALEKLKSSATGTDIVPDKIVENARQLDSEMSKLSNTVSQIKITDSLKADDLQIDQTIIRLNDQLRKNGKYSKDAKEQIRSWIVELENGNIAKARLREINVQAKELHSNMASVNQVGQTFFEKIGSKIASLSTYLSAASVLAQAISATRNGITSIKELDTALVDLKKTTTMTAKELEDFYYASNETAKQMGVSTKQIIEQASAWSRLGFSSASAATQMAKLSSQFASISPGMSTDDATTSLVSIMKAYGMEVNDVLDGIMSKINDIGNKFGTSNAEIAEGLRQSSSAMAAVGGTIEDNIALFTAGQEIVQNASQVGNAIRSISMRIRGYDEETQELSDDLVDVTGKVADLTKTASNNGRGISLFTDSTQTEYKSLVTYLGEIADIWEELDQKTQNDLMDKLFGKNRAQVGAAIIKNFDTVRESIETMENSAGSADREMSVIMDSLDYKLNKLSETGTGIAQNLFARNEMKSVIDFLTSLAEGLDFVTEKFGLLGSVGLGAGLFANFKNVGEHNTPPYAALQK